MKTRTLVLVAAILLARSLPAVAETRPILDPVPFTDVKVTDQFWAPRIRLNREKVLPHNFMYCEKVGKVRNFLRVAGKEQGKHEGAVWEDSDLYKVLEGAAYCLAQERDPELEKKVDQLVAIIAAAQQPDGYLNTYFTLVEPKKRWTDDNKHETYCAGHLIEAAVAYYQATGKRAFLDVAVKLADHLWDTFGPGKQTDVSEHQEIELALFKLYRVTGQERYLRLAQLFVDRRGHYDGRVANPKHKHWGEYCQDHKPVRDQTQIVGHAVRAMYLYSGVADLARVTFDPGYLKAMDAIWHDVVDRKMYLTGGIGPSASNEGFTVAYDLPNDSAYAETCAAIGMALWNQRMALLHADAKYADVVERAMYNGALSGVSLDGEKFFYVNPLGSVGKHHRAPWHGCACCPTNVVRFLPTVGGYALAKGDLLGVRELDVTRQRAGRDGATVTTAAKENAVAVTPALFVNQYMASDGKATLSDGPVTIRQETRYPWEGAVKLTVGLKKEMTFALCLRIPGWCQGPQSKDDLYQIVDKPAQGAATVKVNGQPVQPLVLENGYARLLRGWKDGDVVELDLPMPLRRVRAHPAVKANAGRVALTRGPIVYCLEGVDNGGRVRDLALPPDAKLESEFRADLLGGVVVVKGTALRKAAGGAPQDVPFVAVPYYAWDNRAGGEMVVWMPEKP